MRSATERRAPLPHASRSIVSRPADACHPHNDSKASGESTEPLDGDAKKKCSALPFADSHTCRSS